MVSAFEFRRLPVGPTALAGTPNATRRRKRADINPPRSVKLYEVAKPQTRQRRRAVLRSAQGYIKRHLAEFDLTLAQVAEAVGTSPRQLQRAFREEADEEFRAYLLGVRMERARELLTREPKPLPVRLACHRVGYRQPSGLRQAFTRYHGLNPSEVQAPPPDYDEFWRKAEQQTRYKRAMHGR